MSKNSHAYSFDRGEILSEMGASWFVSYAYYQNVDSNHYAWKRVSTYKDRIGTYKSSAEYHAYWLEKVLDMSISRLATNKMGLSGTEVKNMAKAILEKVKRYFVDKN